MEQVQSGRIVKVCHVVRRFVTDEWGGTENVVYSLAEQFEKKNCSSPVFTTSMFSKAGEDEIGLVKVKRFSYFLPWFGLDASAKHCLMKKGGSPLSFSMLYELFLTKDLSIIHVHSLHRLGGVARTVARLRGIPYVVSLHGGHMTMPEDQLVEMKKPFQGKWEWGKLFGFLLGSRKVLNDADAIICVGKEESKLMAKEYPTKRVIYQPNGVDIKKFSNANESCFRDYIKLQADEKYILCVSRIDSQKNQKVLIEAYAELSEEFKAHYLVLIGPITVASYMAELKEVISLNGLEKKVIIVPGFAADNSLLASAYKGADLFVLPSKHEPFGIVVLEAWAAGLPVLAARVGGIKGFTRESYDVELFNPEDYLELSEKVRRVLTQKKFRDSLGENGRESVEQYDWSIIAKQTMNLYEDLSKQIKQSCRRRRWILK